MKYLIVILIILFAITGYSQDIVKPGKIYNSGDNLIGPRFGIKSKVPQGWMGVLPMDTEVFLLMSESMDGEIYVTTDSTNLDDIKDVWFEGLDLDNGNTLKSDGKIFERGDAIASNVVLEKSTIKFKGYIEAKCGEYGNCISFLLLCPPQNFDKLKSGLIEMSDHTSFFEPSMISIYDEFNWKEFLSGKYLANFDFVPGSKSENEIWLCPDGTFRSKIVKKGLFKDEAKEFQGKKKGTWESSSIGPNGILTLQVDKIGEVIIELGIDNDRIFLSGKRYFVMFTDDCK